MPMPKNIFYRMVNKLRFDDAVYAARVVSGQGARRMALLALRILLQWRNLA